MPTIPLMRDVPPWIVPALLALFWIVWAVVRRISRSRVRYRPREFLLTPGERRFEIVLDRALPDGVRSCYKVRLGDVIDTPTGMQARERRIAWNRIAAKHLDFVLVDEETSRILAAIELDDRSHERADRRTRDEFVDAALESAGVPLLRVRVVRRYDPETLLDPIAPALRRAGRAASAPSDNRSRDRCRVCRYPDDGRAHRGRRRPSLRPPQGSSASPRGTSSLGRAALPR